MDKPTTIFKFEAFSAQSLQNLKAQSIYFGSPLGFNDPYDCALKPGLIEPSDEELIKLREYYSNRPDVPVEIQNEFKSAINIDELRRIIKNISISVLNEHTDKFLKNQGVACFSDRNNDLLMWSHYGGRYKGFCLEFFTSYEPFTRMLKVNYVEEMPKFNAVKALMRDDYSQMLDFYCTKARSWEYEHEWRILHEKAGTLFCYEASALKSVYFGPDIDIQSLEIICLILAGQNPNVKFWKGQRSQEKFEVLFDEFKYTSHLEAKSKGLL